MKTIYYAYPSLSSFIRLDVDELSEHARIIRRDQQWATKWKLPVNLLRQFFFLLLNYRKINVVIASFAGYHSFLPVLFARIKGIPSFIVLNGTDSVSIPELNYGSHRKKILRFFCRYTVDHATELWPVSGSLIRGVNTFTGKKLIYGVRESFPRSTTPFNVIHNGFNAAAWIVNEGAPAERNGVITVVSGRGQFALKGIDLLLVLAVRYPGLPFTVVGMSAPEDLELPGNVHFTGRVEQEVLKQLFGRHRYYMQLSSFEGFGCSLCEAMLCGCIPIVADVNEMPHIVGEAGFVLAVKDPDALALILEKGLEESEEQQQQRSQAAVKRIVEEFPITRRIAKMLAAIDSAASN